jgi:hypothetical protein
MDAIYIYILATLSIVLGFFALLKQKTYVDADTKQPTEVELPLVGKLKSNYPALVFVVLGFGASIFAFNKSFEHNKDVGTDTWTILGSFYPDSTCTAKIDRDHVKIQLDPRDIIAGPDFDATGRSFAIMMNIEKGKSFEDAIQAINFSVDSASVDPIEPTIEYNSFNDKKKSKLQFKSGHVREYIIPVSRWAGSN